MFNLQPLNTPMKLDILTKILLPICSIAIIVALFFALCAKSDKGKKITKICLASVLLFLFVFKAIFWIIRLITISTDNSIKLSDLSNIIGFNMITYVIILAIVVLFISAFSKRKLKFLEFLKQTLFGVGLPIAIYNLIMSKMIYSQDSLFHIVNIDNIIMLIILITSIIYLVKIDDIKLSISKFWYAIAGYICLTSIAMTLSIVSFNGNYSEITYASTLYKIGIKISFPWHLLITIPIFLIISFGIYYLFTLIFKNHTEKDSKNNEENKNDFFEIYSFSTKSICCMQGFLILILLSAIVRNPLGTWLGILCLIPLIMTIFCILATFELDKLSQIKDENIFEQKEKHTKSITYLMLGNFIFGLSYIRQLKNEKLAVIERRERAERKRLRALKKQEQKLTDEENNK